MLRAKKAEIVDSLRGVFSDAAVIVVTHYQGLSVAEVTDLRRGMRAAGARFRVTLPLLNPEAAGAGPVDAAQTAATVPVDGPTAARSPAADRPRT